MAIKTQIVMNRRAFDKSMKKLGDAYILGYREEMDKQAKIWADGYSKIVSPWERKPRFRPLVSYFKSTRRFFVRVQIIGDSEKEIGRFNAIDFGLRRSKKVGDDGGLIANKVRKDKPKSTSFVNIPAGIQRGKGTGRHRAETADHYAEYVRELKKEYTVYRGGGGPPKGKKDSMPMRFYLPFTSKGGFIGGSGKYPGPVRAFVYEYTQGDIEARNWTVGLFNLVAGRTEQPGTRAIWPKARSFASFAAAGNRKGTQLANKALGN